MSYAKLMAGYEPTKPTAFVQFGRGLTDQEISERLVMSYADQIDGPVHFVPAIKILEPDYAWPRRGVLNG